VERHHWWSSLYEENDMRRKASAFFVSLLISLILWPPAVVKSGPADRGEEIFKTKCAPCHTIGKGRKVGPDLLSVTGNHPKGWLFSFIADPEKMFSTNDPTAIDLLKRYQLKMPNLGLSDHDVTAVINYLEMPGGAVAAEAKNTPVAQAPGQAIPPAPDAGKGERYFSGEIGFKNNGPPCIACHLVAGLEFPGGGTLGPDLTSVYAQLGDGIVSLLASVPFPTMKPIFDRHPLAEDEARDLAAYLKGVAARPAEKYTSRIALASFFVFVIFMLMILFLWRNRLASVRKAMVERAEREADKR
jgi:mono/diheme cytochrome c family protein